MGVSIERLLSAADDKLAQFEMKLWSLMKDEFDLNVQIDELRYVFLERKNVLEQPSSTTENRRSSTNRKEETHTSHSLASSLTNNFNCLKNHVQKCEMHLWSLLDERLAAHSIIEEVRQESGINGLESEDKDMPMSSINCRLPPPPVEDISAEPEPVKKKRVQIGKKTFICDLRTQSSSHMSASGKFIALTIIISIELNPSIFIIAGDSPYTCNTCGQTFSRRSHLQDHRLTHQERYFTCEVCSRKFQTLNVVIRHMRTHSKSKEFVCEICEKRFRTKPTLKSHMKTHSGLKPHVCEQCNRAFGGASNLRRHMLIHTGNVDFDNQLDYDAS